MCADKTYGVDINGSGGKVLRMGIDKPSRDRNNYTTPWCIQFWIKFRDAKKNKQPHAQFCIFVPPDGLRGLKNRTYSGRSERSKHFSISVRGVGTKAIRVQGFYETGSEGASTEVNADELEACLEDLFHRLDSDCSCDTPGRD